MPRARRCMYFCLVLGLAIALAVTGCVSGVLWTIKVNSPAGDPTRAEARLIATAGFPGAEIPRHSEALQRLRQWHFSCSL